MFSKWYFGGANIFINNFHKFPICYIGGKISLLIFFTIFQEIILVEKNVRI